MVSSFPDTTSETTPGAIQGAVLGGHSPIIGAELYVFQAGTSYGGAAVNKLTAADAQGTDPIHGAYVLTSSTGTFSISGEYTCTAGYPVYLAAVGGTTTVGASVLHITNSAETAATITFTAANTLTAGASVSFASGAFTTASGYSALNGLTVATTSVSATKFKIANSYGITKTGATGYALAGGAPNPAIVNLAVLGICPGTANEFATNLPFVYINELTTVAAAEALNGFGTGPYNIGAPASNLTGIVNAANTAGNLYNITKNSPAALYTRNGLYDQLNGTVSTGLVPQEELDTLGNILAGCVDSANTATAPQASCTNLFDNATSNGVANGGTVPADTATAAFNIAAHPASNVGTLYDMQGSGVAPFAPALTTPQPPHDWTVTIAYSGGGLGATSGKSPHSVAVDASGNIYTVNYSGGVMNVFGPTGVPQSATGYSNGGELQNPVSVAVDNTSSSVWIANATENVVSNILVSGTAKGGLGFPNATAPYQFRDAVLDATSNLYVAAATNNDVFDLQSNGGYGQYYTLSGFTNPYGIAIDPAGDIWVADQGNNSVSECNITVERNGQARYDCPAITNGGINNPVGNAIDSYSDVWFGNSSGTLSAYTSAGMAISGNNGYTTGASSLLDGIAIDGANDVWATNPAGNALYEFSNTYTAGRFGGGTETATEITPASGYSATTPDGIAIDGSGNVWYNSTSTAMLYQVIGVATPVVTPISLAVANGELGTEP